MCANAGPAEYNYDETLSTLRYANRAKNIKNKPIINEDPKDAMLREYHEEIAKLRAQLGGMPNLPNEQAERKSYDEDESQRNEIHEEKLRQLEEKAAKERAELLAISGEEMTKLQTEQKQSAEERRILEDKLQEQSRSQAAIDQQRHELQQRLQDMEAQLMIGGEITSKAAKQEAELRKAQQELIAKREEELILARQMSEKEEANFQLEEQYSSLQEACQSITKKLKKLWKKYQQAKDEIEDLHSEFQTERTNMLDTIRELETQLKLKNLVIDNFIPPKVSVNE
jgi:chromosome segregation ATPase